MPTFASSADLRDSLHRAGLGSIADDIAATARPDILFTRQSTPDDSLMPGASKVGGHPDLPPGFVWPSRGPLHDIAARERQTRTMLKQLRSMIDDDDQYDDLVRKENGRLRFLERPLPLAFVAQVDLAAMALEPGFDDLLPDTGVLSVFYDLTDGYSGSPRLFWHECPRVELCPRRAPQELIDYYETYGSLTNGGDEPLWPRLTHAEVLLPQSGLSVPAHWRNAYPDGSSLGGAIEAWFDAPDGAVKTVGEEDTMSFGDHLGGWPEPIQHQPETEIDGADIQVAGQTPWRHILSLNVGEFQEGTRLMVLNDTSDGQHYIFMRDDDLRTRRFDRAETIHQMT